MSTENMSVATNFLGDMAGVALITGAASGIGRECAIQFSKFPGAKIIIVDRDEAGLLSLQKELKLPQDSLIVSPMDISKEAEVTALFEKIEKQFGGLNYVLNGAGVLGGQYENRLDEVDESTWDFVMNINFRGQVLMTKSQVKLMLKSKPLPSKHSDRGTRRGVIVNMGSIASIRARSHAGAPYIASKHALHGLTKSTAVTYGPDGIRCLLIAPAMVYTPMVHGHPVILPAWEKLIQEEIPMRRWTYADEVVDLILFLWSERAAYISGNTINFDGAWCAR